MHNTAFVDDGTTVTEQQMIMKELSGGAPDADADVLALAGNDFFFLREYPDS